jgi:2-polyprenyl-6-methoxyphenol hydroxylase-like FAD-dependent oxidoreductase
LTAPRHAAAPASLDELRDRFGHFDGAPARLLERLTDLPPSHHDLEELDQPVWGTPRVLLLGDAAHAMTPNLGQGAAMAIEDAFALEQSLRDGVDGALPRYQSVRNGRVRTIQLQSRRIGAIAHTEGRVQQRLRNLALRAVPTGAMRRQQAKLVEPGLALLGAASPVRR